MTITQHTGRAAPLGRSKKGNITNFAVYSKSANNVSLGIFIKNSSPQEFPLNKSGDVWHISLSNIPIEFTYAYKVDESDWTADPYFHERCFFDWEGVEPPKIPWKDLIIYEMHVRGFTIDPSSKVKHPGTFLGIIEKIPYFKSLGINAVELMPIFAFDSSHSYWGYNPHSFFLLEPKYLNTSLIEFKMFVKELHKNGIEVLLDVVFNHTTEKASLHTIDKSTYFLLSESGEFKNYSGCGNTVNCNHKIARKLIVDSLRYWIDEMHVDGFRFDLASILTRGEDGNPLETPPLIEEITKLSLEKKIKLIAEPWDAAGLYSLGFFQKKGETWSEWNDQFRDGVRRFIKGDHCNFQDLFLNNSTIHFITAHDGFTLRDLVTYEQKHNFENGEENRDGSNHNISWNCGIEGETEDSEIQNLRDRQMRNFLLALLLSKGTPMLLMGDEYGHTRRGNNNPYAKDHRINWFCWDELENKKEFFSFVSFLISLRKSSALDWEKFQKNSFLSKDLFIAFNPSSKNTELILPKGNWKILINTSNPQTLQKTEMAHSNHLFLGPYSSLLARSI